MTLLAIDTSSAFASVALFDGRTVLAELTWHAQRRHDDHLFGAIRELLSLGSVEPAGVTRVAVAIGPGSFTGLRVGIAAAQGISRASGAALVGVGTLDVIAHPFATARRRVCALVGAGRGEHYSAMYRTRHGRWERVSDITIGPVGALARSIRVDTLFVGEVDDAAASALRLALGERAAFASPSANARRAGHLAEIAWSRADAGETATALEPLYIRPPPIRGPAAQVAGASGAVAHAVRQAG